MTDGSAPARPIRRLLPATVERIAAGEVVERPASVVKELVENALDAGAATVVVRLRDGGLDRIEVADDGAGISPDELELAVERHATSKLDPAGPVEQVGSLGFRGEALAAIGSVSRMRLTARPADREAAEGISVVGGETVGRFPAARAPGTTVEVEDLFFNTPARRKFLRSPAAEQVEVVRTVERLYLARPTVALRVESEGREVLACAPTPSLRDAVAHVLGAPFLAASFDVRGDVPGGRLFGAIGLPAVAAPTSGLLYVAVNGRPVVSRAITQGVRVAFGDALPRSRFPTGALHLELDPRTIDVNVHPTKREIRFAREGELADAVRRLVRSALAGRPAPSDLVRGESPPSPGVAGPLIAERTSDGGSAPAGQRTLDEAAPAPADLGEAAATARGPSFELLGVLDALYWVAATDDGFVLLDQHAASERLLYEALRRDGTIARQQLVTPVSVDLSAAERAAWAAHAATVASAGFELDAFGPSTVRVRSVPTYRGRSARAEAIRDLLRELADGGRPTLPDGLAERTAATIACHAAIRAGDTVAPDEIRRLVAALDALPERVRSCPHGRPIFVRIPRARLDGWFLRRGA